MPRSTRIPIDVLPIENDGFHLFIKGKINRKNATFIIDTGASRSVFDEIGIEKYLKNNTFDQNEQFTIGVGSAELKSKITTMGQLRLGSLIIKEYQTVLLDLQQVRQTYERLKLPAVQGIIGSDILENYKAVIDFSSRKLKLTY